MTNGKHLVRVVRWVTCERRRRLQREVAELRAANAELAIERDAADALLSKAMDEALAWRGPHP